jgi:hypothetical protein
LQQEPTYIDDLLLSILKERETIKPTLFLISVLPGIYIVLLDQHNGLKPSS